LDDIMMSSSKTNIPSTRHWMVATCHLLLRTEKGGQAVAKTPCVAAACLFDCVLASWRQESTFTHPPVWISPGILTES
jgi:hypothetical protein